LVLLAVLLVVVSVVVSRWKDGPSEVLLVLALVAGVGGVLLTRLTERDKQRDASKQLLKNTTLTTGVNAVRTPTVGETDIKSFGVHTALKSIQYLHRDAEASFLDDLKTGSPVLVLGPSMAGKTRMAAQVVRENFREWMLVIPDVPDGLAQLMNNSEMPHGAVIWFNDLERYIGDPKNLKGRWLDELNAAGNIVVATMRENAYDSFQPTGNLDRTQWEVLSKFRTVRILDNDDERQRLAKQCQDPRMAEGISRYGVGAYVGGGFLAKKRLESGQSQHPLGVALILTAVDWSRTGISEAIPQSIAESIAPVYLTQRQLGESREDFPSAISWATDWDVGAGAFRLLSPVGAGWRPFDYLLDHLAVQGDKIPDEIWDAVARVDEPSVNFVTAGVTAYRSGKEEIAERLFTRAVTQNDTDAIFNLGVLHAQRNEVEQAEELWRKGADLGDPNATNNLGVLHAQRGEITQAEERWLQATALGNTGAMIRLGHLYDRQGKTTQAENLYSIAADLGDPTATFNLGFMHERRGDITQAEHIYRKASDLGSPKAMAALGAIYESRGETTQAEHLYQRAADLGEPLGMNNLGVLLAARGATDQAEDLWRKAADGGDQTAMFNLSIRHDQRGETTQAENLRRKAAGPSEADMIYGELGILRQTTQVEYLLPNRVHPAAPGTVRPGNPERATGES
jgi:TPR repeat protein